MDKARNGWRQVRLRVETVARLREYMRSQQREAEQGKRALDESGSPGGGEPSLDALVNDVLDRIHEHRFRAKAQRERAAARRRAAVRANIFDAAWLRLHEQGTVDAATGAECGRVWMAWYKAGQPSDVEAFIRQEAARGPQG